MLSNAEMDILAYGTVFFNVDYLCKIPRLSFKEKKIYLRIFKQVNQVIIAEKRACLVF